MPRGYESHLVFCVVHQDADGYIEASEFSPRLASVLLCYGGIEHILNVGHWLVMVSICRSSQKQLGYDCIFCKNIQWFRKMCLHMVVALHRYLENLRF